MPDSVAAARFENIDVGNERSQEKLSLWIRNLVDRPNKSTKESELLAVSSVDYHTALWLIRLRWCVVFAQVTLFLVLAVVPGPLHFSRHLAGVLVTVLITNILANSVLAKRRCLSRWTVGSMLLLDMGLLTIVLLSSGGPANPFTVLYLVHITLTAAVLGARWTWAATVSTIVAFGLLFLVDIPHSGMSHSSTHVENVENGFSMHLYGMWIAFTLAAGLIAIFVCTILSSLKARDEEVSIMRLRAEKNDRFASLVTLAAGAAHELGSPLATIAIISSELERLAISKELPQAVEDDARLLQAEVRRCKAILDEMRGQAESAESEEWQLLKPVELADEIRKSFPSIADSVLEIDCSSLPEALFVPKHGLLRSLRALIRNSLNAVSQNGRIQVRVLRDQKQIVFSVSDNGLGMSPEVLAHATEPFFTTKPVGEGMGLGLFLVRIFCEKYGGILDIESSLSTGTRVIFNLPNDALNN